jgi:hypothetical protein
MSGYLEEYGVEEQHRAFIVKRVAIGVAAALLVALVLFLVLHNRSEKKAGENFLAALRAGNYQHAYVLWGCTAAKPCPDYSYQKFLEDWGPKGVYADSKDGRIANVDSCGDGVVLTMNFPKTDPFGMYVDRSTKTLGFAPWPRCPGRHWHLWDFIKSKL